MRRERALATGSRPECCDNRAVELGKGQAAMGQDQDDTVVAPYTTVMNLIKRSTKIDMFTVSAVSRDAVDQAQKEMESLLRQRHRIQPGRSGQRFGLHTFYSTPGCTLDGYRFHWPLWRLSLRLRQLLMVRDECGSGLRL